MRVGRAFAAGRWQSPLSPFAPGGIFTRDMTSHALAASQVFARQLGNQLSYANPLYSYDGKPAPSFYGYAGIGYGQNTNGFQTVANIQTFTPALFIVPAGHPTEAVTYVNSLGEAQPPGAGHNLQASFEAVPVPILAKVPSGRLTAEGTDKECVIWQPSTGKMWEMFRLEGKPGAWTFQYGAFIGPGSTHGANGAPGEWDGIFGAGEGGQIYGARASGLAAIGGSISLQDLVEVLRGGPIRHALSLSLPVTENAHVAPATRNDSIANVPEKHEGAANPAYPRVDQVPEGSWFTFPAASKPGDFGITGALAIAVFEAIRVYGVFINDGSGACSFSIESPVSLGSPYCYAKVNPFAGATEAQPGYVYANTIAPGSWADATLPTLQERITGTASIWMKMPWKELQLLEPFAI
jgi:hypothetical protein